MYFVFFLLLFSLFIITLFAFPRFSPIPYYPTNKKDLALIVKALQLKSNQVVFDLGAGDGIVIFSAASVAYKQKLNTQFVAVDINPVLIIILYIKRLFHPNRRNIKIIWGDMFKMSSLRKQGSRLDSRLRGNDNITFYLYISPWLLEKTVSKIKKDLKKFTIVSYFYPVKSLKRKEKVVIGKNKIYIYDYSEFSP